ncbi:sensor domain-containing diguanylate cyclase [Sneathiella glossodoripedis]|uniref:sensor domain-containing diguanylate cyclase n=1 Tax=Sneathiella glossodoripedis TaxID=418853 RepID=UPI00046F75FB|nr:diguanylate cyclase [Sneathiella glossodoripedis]
MSLVKTSDIAKHDLEEQGRILIVESSHLYLTLIEGAVNDVFSGQVDKASTFDEVKSLIEEHKGEYFLVLLNLVLPGASQGEAVNYVRNYDLPAVVFTSSVDEALVNQIQSLGVIDYIIKENVTNLELVSKMVRRLDHNRRITALIVDDSATMREQMQVLLSKYLFKIEVAENGVEALEKVRSDDTIRLVITDYEMPKMNGFELIKKLRTFKESRDLAIVGMSSDERDKLATDFIRFGADDFVKKGISHEEFATRISLCMDKLDLLNELMLRATTDFLTKLWNRMYFMSASSTLFSSASRGQITIDVAMIDLDHFKRINDTYGHDAGDEVLREVAAALKSIIRGTDLLARMGGEEFCLLAVNVSAEHREKFFNSLREAVSELEFSFNGENVRMSASMGITSILGDSVEDMMNRADAALYEAKEAGRNQCVFAD